MAILATPWSESCLESDISTALAVFTGLPHCTGLQERRTEESACRLLTHIAVSLLGSAEKASRVHDASCFDGTGCRHNGKTLPGVESSDIIRSIRISMQQRVNPTFEELHAVGGDRMVLLHWGTAR